MTYHDCLCLLWLLEINAVIIYLAFVGHDATVIYDTYNSEALLIVIDQWFFQSDIGLPIFI